MEKEMLNADSHVYLYAKGHYAKSKNMFNDLRKIYAIRNGVDAKDITDWNILEMMLSLTYQHIKSEYAFKEFVSHLFKTYRKKTLFPLFGISTKRKLLKQILITLGLTQVKDGEKILIPLDEPDFTILPSQEEYTKKELLTHFNLYEVISSYRKEQTKKNKNK